MDNGLLSILLLLVGLLVGFGASFLLSYFRVNNASKRVEAMINQARKDAEKVKRETILEQKEEAHKLKLETEKEIKEKKDELKEAESRLLQREASMDKRDELYQ